MPSVEFEIEFPDGSTEQTRCHDITLVNDQQLEHDHDFSVTITGAGSSPHATVIDPSITTVTIMDDESKLL